MSPPQQQFINGRARSEPAEKKDNGKDDELKPANHEQAMGAVREQWMASTKIETLY
jgi:hypothetical protein